MPLDLEVVTPERELVHEQVDEVQVPAKEGFLGVLPGHAPLISELGSGELAFTTGGRERYIAVQGGFVEIVDDHVRVLADSSEHPEEIDLERAQREYAVAQEQVLNPRLDVDPATALEALQWAQTRIAVAGRRR